MRDPGKGRWQEKRQSSTDLSLSISPRISYILLLHNCTTTLELGLGYGGSSAIVSIIIVVVDVLMLLMVPAHKETP